MRHFSMESIKADNLKPPSALSPTYSSPSSSFSDQISDILKKLKYNPRQVNIEDYDLWLRLLSRGYIIEKINEPLLLYRIHDKSVTNLYLKKKNFFFKHLRMKRIFLANEILSGRINRFVLRVIISTIMDFIKGTGKAIKNLFR